MSEFDTVIVRRNIVAEVYGAHLWATHRGTKTMTTEPITKLSTQQLEEIRDKKVLIVGGYYSKNMTEIISAVDNVVVFLNDGDPYHGDGYTTIGGGNFVEWAVTKINITDPITCLIAKYLDEYMYGDPSKECMCFQNGVYTLDEPNDLLKILSIKTEEDVHRVLERGLDKYIANEGISQNRLKTAVEMPFRVDGRSYTAMVAIGDSPVVHSCLALAQTSTSGIGMMFRYSLAQQKTFISIRVLSRANANAGHIMAALVDGGGGSSVIGGGSIDGLVFPHENLKDVECTH